MKHDAPPGIGVGTFSAPEIESPKQRPRNPLTSSYDPNPQTFNLVGSIVFHILHITY